MIYARVDAVRCYGSTLAKTLCNTIPLNFASECWTNLKRFSTAVSYGQPFYAEYDNQVFKVHGASKHKLSSIFHWTINQKQSKITIACLRAIWASWDHTSSYVNRHLFFVTKCRHYVSDGHTKFYSINLHWTVWNTSITSTSYILHDTSRRDGCN